jgi:hypothetical protein
MNSRITFAACLILVLFPIVSSGEVWNLADDFSIAQNPNGAWSYGWRTVSEQPLVLYTEHTMRCGAPQELENWNHYIEDDCPRVTHNPQNYPVTCDYAIFEPHTVNFHPGPNQQSVVRWTAPAGADVVLTVHFQAIDTGSSIVTIYHSGTSVFSTTLDYLGETADFSTVMALTAGDVIDCAIDPISFYGDSVQLDFAVETTEPTPVAESTWGRVKVHYR